jgi:prepilin-type N-terminal cleavage/methylation domain-containing protein/prepilin-type processing-associated H-X9-DG protein
MSGRLRMIVVEERKRTMGSKKKGFTLIELLVVVAIIAVLIAILLPSLGRARDQAKTVKCSNNLRTMYQGLNSYQSEFDGTAMPYKMQGPLSAKNGQWFGPQLLGAQYGKNAGISAKDADAMTAAYKYVQQVLLMCPTNIADWSTVKGGTTVGYAYNSVCGDLTKNPPIVRKWVSLPPQMMLSHENHPFNERGDHDWYFSKIDDLFTYDNSAPDAGYGLSPQVGHPHAGDKKGNMLFADGQIILDDPFKLNTTDGVQQSTAAPGSAAGTDYRNIVDPFKNDPKRPFPF